MNINNYVSRGDFWFQTLTQSGQAITELCPSVKAADVEDPQFGTTRYIAVVPDKNNHFPRATHGEVGLLEGWTLGKVITETIQLDKNKSTKRPIVAVIDVASQAYGRREEAFGIHQALAAAANAYAQARLAGHPVIGLIVGKAMSGAFLAHGYQANRLVALNSPEVMIHAMGKAAAARITLRSVDDLEKLAETIPPMAYDIKGYETLGLLWRLLNLENDQQPNSDDITLVKNTVAQAIIDTKKHGVYLENRLNGENRKSSAKVRELMRQQW